MAQLISGKIVLVIVACTNDADWCENLFGGYCYDPAVADTCCARCAQVNTNDASTLCLLLQKLTDLSIIIFDKYIHDEEHSVFS